MSLESTTTPEGLRVYVDPMPDREITKVIGFVGVGGIHESNKFAGISHALEHCVHVSTELFPDEKALDEFTGVNALTTNADTHYNRTCYEASGPDVEPNFQRLGELLFRATFNPKYTSTEIATIVREAYSAREDCNSIHGIGSDYALFGRPYGRSVIGYADKINFTPDQLQKFYNRHYVMSNIAIVAVGNTTMEDVLQNVERYFDFSSKKPPVPKKITPNAIDALTTGLSMEHYETALVRVSAPMDKAFIRKYLANKVLYETAVQAVSDLCFKRFRQDTGISYDGSIYFYDYNATDAWSIGGNATVDPSDVKKTRTMFKDILSRPGSSYTDSAIASAIGASRGGVLSILDSIDERTELYVQDLEHGVKPSDAAHLKNAVNNFSFENVRNAIDEVAEYIDLHPPRTHITGPKKAVKLADKVFDISEIA